MSFLSSKALGRRNPRAAWALALCLVLLCPGHARASAFGEENITLLAILAEQVKQTFDMAETLSYLQSTLELARQTTSFARSSVEAVASVGMILEDPDAFMAAQAESFVHSFPAVNAIMTDVLAIKESIRHIDDPVDHYDPYAFAKVLVDLRSTKDAAYDVVAHTIDYWGIGDPHDEMIENLRAEQAAASQVLNDIEVLTGLNALTPQAAQALGAKAAAIDANASVESAAIQNEMLRVAKLRLFHQMSGENQARVNYLDQSEHDFDVPASWSLEVGGVGR